MPHIIPEDLYCYSLLSGVKLSPDGKRIAFVRTCPEITSGKYRSEIWCTAIDGTSSTRLYSAYGCKIISWQDPETVLILHNGILSLKLSGDTTSLLEQNGIQTAASFANGCFIYTTAVHNKTRTPPSATVFDELPFWVDGRGIRNGIRDALMLYDPKYRESRQLSEAFMNVTQFVVSPDGRKVAFAATSYKNVMPKATGIYLYDQSTQQIETLVSQSQNHLHSLLAFLSNEELLIAGDVYRFLGSNPHFCIHNLETKGIYHLPFSDVSIGGGMVTDLSWGAINNWAVDGGTLYFATSSETTSIVMQLESNGLPKPLFQTNGALSFDVKGKHLVFVGLSPERPPELYALNLDTQECMRLTGFHDDYVDRHHIEKPHMLEWKNRCGTAFKGWVLPPANMQSDRRYPAILAIHGGPLGVWDACFNHEMQCLSHAGFFVFYTNPRGASGRGEEFSNLSGISGTIDYEDLMDFCDHALNTVPQIDPGHIGVCGGSYGGYMCNWIIGHTHRFSAAVSQRSISNFFTKQLCSDNGYVVTRALTQADPLEDPEAIWQQSPLRYADNITTPTLFIQSNQDYCCYLSDSIQMYIALKQRNIPARLCMFHGESHSLSRTGRPPNRIARLHELIAWFRQWLQP